MKTYWLSGLLLFAASCWCDSFSEARKFESMVPSSDLIAVATVSGWQWKMDSDTETAILKVRDIWMGQSPPVVTIPFRQIHANIPGQSQNIPRQGIDDGGTYLFFLKKGDGRIYEGAGTASHSFLISKNGTSRNFVRYQYPLTFILFKNSKDLIKVMDISKKRAVEVKLEQPECEKFEEPGEKKECRIYLDDLKKYIQSGMYKDSVKTE